MDKIILKGRVGSHAYGLATEDSDEDFLGVYLEPTGNFLGLTPGERDSKVTKDPDTTLHELGKYCRLALACNPKATELMWLNEYTENSFTGAELISIRSSFLSDRAVRNAYFGYATQQFKRLRDRGDSFSAQVPKRRVAKHARHLLRLLSQGYQLWSRGELQVRMTNPDYVLSFGERVAVQADEGRYELVENALRQYEDGFDRCYSVLPAEPDRDLVDSWLRSVRLDNLN